MATGYTGGQDQAGDPRVEEASADEGILSSITGAASTAGNFLWTNLIWDSEAPLWMNLGGAAISVVSIATAIPSGGLSLLAGGAALRASMGVVAKAALSEVAVGTVTATGMYAAAEGIEYITGDEPQETLTDEEYQAALDELSALSTPGSPEALAHAAAREAELAAEEVAAEESETPAEEAELSLIEQNYNDTVAGLQTMLGSFIPDELEGVVINLCAMFQIATMGDGDENTSKLDELSFLGGKFFDAVMGGTPSQDVPAPANADRAPKPEMSLVS